MKVAVVEYFNGCAPELDPDLLLEGYAMLRSAVEDFSAIGVSVETILDRRLEAHSLSAKVHSVEGRGEFRRELKKVCRVADASLIIAPEYILPELIEEAGYAKTLNSDPDAIRSASDKCKLMRALARLGLDVPETRCLEPRVEYTMVRSVCRDLGYPVVFKPAVGAGCEGLSLARAEDEVEPAYRRAYLYAQGGCIILQRWCDGVAASVSLLVHERGVIPLSLNRQILRISSSNERSAYLGGVVPLPHIIRGDAFKASIKAAETLTGLRGYIGVDMVLTESKPIILEVNPRLTVSYIGLRRILDVNIASLMLNPENHTTENLFEPKGYASFIKAETSLSFKLGSMPDGVDMLCSPITSGRRICFMIALGEEYASSLAGLRKALLSAGVEADAILDDLGA